MRYNTDNILFLQRKNPWWSNVSLIEVDEKLQELKSLKYQYHFSQLDRINLKDPGIYTIRGIRQIGKSTAIKILVKQLLLSDKVDPKSIVYFSCESIHDDRELFALIDAYLKNIAQSSHAFIFIDEITSVSYTHLTLPTILRV